MTKIDQIKSVFQEKGYKIFTRAGELNIVGVRNPDTKPDTFNDQLFVFWKTATGDWISKVYPITTDPGLAHLVKPYTSRGTAILKAGQYIDVYALDIHARTSNYSHLALCQRKGNVTVVQDYNADNVLDFQSGRKKTGSFGINIHRATAWGTSTKVGRWSAGCQVFPTRKDFDEFIELCKAHRSLHGNTFTYTLIDLRELERLKKVKISKAKAKNGAVITLSILALLGIGAAIWAKITGNEG